MLDQDCPEPFHQSQAPNKVGPLSVQRVPKVGPVMHEFPLHILGRTLNLKVLGQVAAQLRSMPQVVVRRP